MNYEQEVMSVLGQASEEELLRLLKIMAIQNYDGHYTIMAFTTHFKVGFGTPDLDSGYGRKDIQGLDGFKTLREALKIAILRESARIRSGDRPERMFI